MSIFKKKQPIDNFNASYLHIKVALHKTFKGDDFDLDIRMRRYDSGVTDDKVGKFAAQGVDYLLGERPDITIGTKGLADKCIDDIRHERRFDTLRAAAMQNQVNGLGVKFTVVLVG